MAITDAQRHRLHNKLDQVLGEEDAAVLISHLPPSGWSDVVRTRDLDQLEARLDARFAALEARFDARFDAVDARFEAMEARFEARFETIDARFLAVDARFDTTEARFGESLERAMREQTNRFLVYLGVVVTLVTAAGELIGRAVGA